MRNFVAPATERLQFGQKLPHVQRKAIFRKQGVEEGRFRIQRMGGRRDALQCAVHEPLVLLKGARDVRGRVQIAAATARQQTDGENFTAGKQ